MEGYLSGNRRDFSDETKEAIDVNRSLAKKERKKAFQTDGR